MAQGDQSGLTFFWAPEPQCDASALWVSLEARPRYTPLHGVPGRSFHSWEHFLSFSHSLTLSRLARRFASLIGTRCFSLAVPLRFLGSTKTSHLFFLDKKCLCAVVSPSDSPFRGSETAWRASWQNAVAQGRVLWHFARKYSARILSFVHPRPAFSC